MKIEGETVFHRGEPTGIADVLATNCEFRQCVVRSNSSGWNRFSNINLVDAVHWNCALSGSAFENVTLHNLKKAGSAPLFIWASVFRNVKLSGRIAGLKINRNDLNPAVGDKERAKREAITLQYYADVDWALDISAAKFPGGVTFEAVPGDKIIRNPDTQVLIKRGCLANRDWRSLDFEQTGIDLAVSWFESGSLFDSVVIAARSESKSAATDRRVLDMLRQEGIAEPD